MDGKHRIEVVIPVYDPAPDEWIIAALKNNVAVLKRHPVCFVAPESLDMDVYLSIAPQARCVRVADDSLGVGRGYKGYNRMLTSAGFYAAFCDMDYVLICHPDAWVFRDEVDFWLDRGYDLVAPPWLAKRVYRTWLFKVALAFVQHVLRRKSELRYRLFCRIGNGGLSLRRVDAFIEVSKKYEREIGAFIEAGGNEDVVWAFATELSKPHWREAAQFGLDVKPAYGYRVNGHRLPMGCHGFLHGHRAGFWSEFIPGLSQYIDERCR